MNYPVLVLLASMFYVFVLLKFFAYLFVCVSFSDVLLFGLHVHVNTDTANEAC